MKSQISFLSMLAAVAMAFLVSTSTVQGQACQGDVNGDHVVDGADLAVLLGQWGPCLVPLDCSGDINGDHYVDGADLAMMLGNWAPCPGPTWATVLDFAPDPAIVTDPILLNAIDACGLPWRVLDNATNIEMLLVPAGIFTMGCSASNANACQSSENPTHQVTLTNCFYMGKTEVTQAQWTAEMGSNPSYFVAANGYSADTTKPVDRVSWDMIQIFNAATGLRLPTEAEWEYAYRAATTTAYHSNPGSPNGTNDDNQLGSIAWYNGNAGGETHAVAGKYANAFGLHDMAGNVAEWVQDWSYSYPSGSVTNPTGPTTGSVVLLRGGFWYAGSDFCRASNRYSDAPSIMRSFFGFRVARDAFDSAVQPSITSVTPNKGTSLGGTAIKITGTNLTGATSVTVGGVAATSVVVNSSTSMSAVTPAGTGAVSVGVTTPDGTATLPAAFTYYIDLTWGTVLECVPDPSVVTDPILLDAIEACGLPWLVQDNATGIEMVLIPAGIFTMGCSASNSVECMSTENPTHQVTLTTCFYMSKTEVTQAQWTAEMGSNPSYFQGGSYPDAANRPVEKVSWSMIQPFCIQNGLRLPTEAEWEYAYRARTTTAFHSFPGYSSGTNDDALLGNIAWYSGNNGASGSATFGTKSVGGKSANGLGLHDMAGNVTEWCHDNYGAYSSSSATDPTGPATGNSRVLRGGSWNEGSGNCRASLRWYGVPWYVIAREVGFRVARNAFDPAPAITSVSPSEGTTLGGTVIKITGTGLLGTTSVTVGGVAATSVVVNSPTSISAVTPAGTGVVSVSVTTPVDTATLPAAFTYQYFPTWATVLEYDPDPGVVTDPDLLAKLVACGLPWRVVDNASGIEMLLIPAGTFTMGCSASTQWGCDSDESPLHQVTLTQAFYMGRYEVTQAQWLAEMGSNPSYFSGYSDSPSRPVEQVSWNMIQPFCTQNGLRLPTEAEWEYAYRAATTTAFHSYPAQPNGFNDDTLVVNIAWFYPGANDQTHAVGGKLANALGLHDMAGNVAEWVQDWFGPYPSGSVTNPTGPTTGPYRLLRGGYWAGYSGECRASRRNYNYPYLASVGIGFRAVRTP